MTHDTPPTRRPLAGLLLAGLTCLTLAGPSAGDEKRKPRYPKPPSDKGVELIPAGWKKVPVQALTPAALDALLLRAQKGDRVKFAGPAPDDEFLRRVYLDLIGYPPSPRRLEKFLADRAPKKRSKVIDDLLAFEDFARHRARVWRDIILARATDNRPFISVPRAAALEAWLFEQFKGDRSWADIARALITAQGGLRLREPLKEGQTGMLLCHTRQDGPVERTNDTARVFLGINLQCAQCHDHPDDVWKREQFHQMAAFYARLGERPQRLSTKVFDVKFSLFSRRFGEYRMPDRDDPRFTRPVQPRFLTGESPRRGLPDLERRQALADYVTAEDNYYFAAAFVNRVWGDLFGQAFVQPVDSLGPLQTPLYGDVLLRLAASFRASDFDIKGLYRLILNSKAYQRRMRVYESVGEHVRFAGIYPTRLHSEALWDALTSVLGPLNNTVEMPAPFAPGRTRQVPLRQVFRPLFSFDPSSRPEDVEGSVPQALMLMNNKALNARIKATGNTILARTLRKYPKDEDVVEQLYLRALGRKPTARERTVCLAHVKEVGKRTTAFEDLLWSLINSTEFRTRR
jgi:hypothetical protein